LNFFHSSSFAHCRSDAIGVAHSLAQEAVSHCLDAMWLEHPPSLICNQLFRKLCNP